MKAGEWLSGQPTNATDFDPFVRKVHLPATSVIAFHGDFHGDVLSLALMLERLNQRGLMHGFRITAPSFYLAFLGDFTDRGHYGIDVLAAIAQLKILNPERVLLVRGNHEDVGINQSYGLAEELNDYLGGSILAVWGFLRTIRRFYNTMPVAIFLGRDDVKEHILCAHGGIEPGYDHGPLLTAQRSQLYDRIGRLNRRSFIARNHRMLRADVWSDSRSPFATFNKALSTPNNSDSSLGFMWNDFTLDSKKESFYIPGRGLVASLFDTAIYSGTRIGAIFRAHQHIPKILAQMKAQRGLYQHWWTREHLSNFRLVPGMVFTFNVGADSCFCDEFHIDVDTFALLRLTSTFREWSVEVLQNDMRRYLKLSKNGTSS